MCNITKLFNFCHFSFEGGGGVKKETKGIKFFIRHQHFDVIPNSLLIETEMKQYHYFCFLDKHSGANVCDIYLNKYGTLTVLFLYSIGTSPPSPCSDG